MQCPFTQDDIRTLIGTRKLLLLKRGSRKYPGKQTLSFYLPIYDSEVKELGLTEQSMVRAEIARVELRQDLKRPAFEIQVSVRQTPTIYQEDYGRLR